jgi:hypothetical protein
VNADARPQQWLMAGLAAVLGLPGLWLAFLAYSQGLCWFDDASFAVVARNLAEGRGYSLPFRFHGDSPFMLHTFDSQLGTGPTSILPVAAAIRVLGAHGWVPGLTHVALELGLLALIAVLLRRCVADMAVLAWLAGALALALLVSTRHLEQWFAQLGETPAALLLLVSVFVAATREWSPRVAALAGLLLGLAVTSKELSGLFVIGISAALLGARLDTWRAGASAATEWRAALAFVACGCAPLVAFELWRLATLGAAGFVANWQDHLAFIRGDSAPPPSSAAALERVLARDRLIAERMGLDVGAAALLGFVSHRIVMARASPPVRRASRMLAWGLCLHAAYWLVWSNGWPRYLYIAVVVWCFFVLLPLLDALPRRGHDARWLVALLVLACGIAQATSVRSLWPAPAPPRDGTNSAERRVIAYLDRPDSGVHGTVFTTYWAHIAALEYFSPWPARFERGALEQLERRGDPIHVVVNLRLTRLFPEPAVEQVAAHCGAPVFEAPPYRVFRCARERGGS